MAGHSKWANIQHRKGAQDRKRAKIFSKCSKAIMSAVKEGGGDPDGNLKLKYAIDQARSSNMPRDNIERAIKSALGDKSGDSFENLRYEGYGPNGVAVMVDALTDNRNRTAPEVRKIFEKFGGKMGATGCVAHMFSRRALFAIPLDSVDEEKLMEIALDCGAEDIEASGDVWEVVGEPEAFADIKAGLEAAGLNPSVAKIVEIASMSVTLDEEKVATRVLKLIDTLDDHDDVQEVHMNFEIPDELMAKLDLA